MDITIVSKQQEISARKKGIIIAIASMGVIFLAFQIWKAPHSNFPKAGAHEYEVTAAFDFTGEIGDGGGMMDYGNNVNGSGKVNNFEDPSPTPGDGPSNVSQTSQAVTNPVENPKLTSDVKTGVTAPPGDKVVKNPDPNALFSEGGSNHGNDPNGNVGNWGRPDYHQLNDNGSFQWGPGGTGLKGRKWISLPDPEYSVNQESKITFEFTILPDGSVGSVKRPISNQQELVRAGMEAIKKWRFEPVDESAGNQSVKVTIIFRLQ